MKELDEILELLSQDACACGACEYKGMKIDVSCRKSNGARDYIGGVIEITGDNKKEMNRIGKMLVKDFIDSWGSNFTLVIKKVGE